jgi:hypothetical protein
MNLGPAENKNMISRVFTSAKVGVVIAVLSLMTLPASAYWQFMERPPGAEVKPSPRYSSKKQCEDALKKAEAALKKAYPDRFPLVGSCEEFR